MATKKGEPGTAANKNKGGRPRKDDAEKLEQFSIRLPPKMKFGLEMLARAQHRSLSQAVEWALQVGLANHIVNMQDDISVAELVDRAWEANSAYERARKIYDLAPALCDYDDYAGCFLIDRSRERTEVMELLDVDMHGYGYALLDQFAAVFWPYIRQLASEIAAKGRDLSNQSLTWILGLETEHDVLESLRRGIEMEGVEPIKQSEFRQPSPRSF